MNFSSKFHGNPSNTWTRLKSQQETNIAIPIAWLKCNGISFKTLLNLCLKLVQIHKITNTTYIYVCHENRHQLNFLYNKVCSPEFSALIMISALLLLMSVISWKWPTFSCIWTQNLFPHVQSEFITFCPSCHIRQHKAQIEEIAKGMSKKSYIISFRVPSMLTCHIHLNIVLNAVTYQVHSVVIDYLFLIRMRHSV